MTHIAEIKEEIGTIKEQIDALNERIHLLQKEWVEISLYKAGDKVRVKEYNGKEIILFITDKCWQYGDVRYVFKKINAKGLPGMGAGYYSANKIIGLAD